jgi:hypothetical protein
VVIALTILIPGMPNMIMFMQMGGDLPPGWSYNPSSWPQRWIMIVLVLPAGSSRVTWRPSSSATSIPCGTRSSAKAAGGAQLDMSHMWPISDGGLGALAYTFEFLMGYMGSPRAGARCRGW